MQMPWLLYAYVPRACLTQVPSMRRALEYLLSITTVVSLLVGATVGAQSTQVLVVPPSSVMAVGAAVTVEVQVHDVLDLYGVDIQIAFDPTVLQVQDADGNSANGVQITPGSFLTGGPGFTALNKADNSSGQIRYMYTRWAPAVAVSGGGVLARITFLGQGPGSSGLPLQMQLANDRAESLPAAVSDGVIVVSGEVGTPTPTAAATRTSTLTATPSATLVNTNTPSRTSTRTPTRTRTPPAGDHRLFLPIFLPVRLVPTLTATPSATPAPTGTITPAATRSPTPTPTASATVSPTASATPTHAVTPSPTPEFRQLLLNPGFETDAAWVLDGGVKPVYTMARVHSELRSIRLGIILPQSQRVWSSIWQEVDLPSHITEAHLSLYYFPVGWPEYTDDIYLYITRASDDTTLFSDRWMRWEQTWHPYTVDLSARLLPYAGQRIRVRIGVYNDGEGMTAVYVDDVELQVAGSGSWVMGNELVLPH